MTNKRIRIIEIAATPSKTPSEVEGLLKPFFEKSDSTLFGMKAGELHGSEHPRSRSFYIAVRSDQGQKVATQAADQFLEEVTTLARSMRLPVIEICGDHREFANLVAQLGW